MSFYKLYGTTYREWSRVSALFDSLSYREPVKRSRAVRDRIRMTPFLWGYLESLAELYGRMLRRAWHLLQSEEFGGGANRARLNRVLQGAFHVSKRAAGSAINDAQGRINAASGKRRLDIACLGRKIALLEGRLRGIRRRVNERKKAAVLNRLTADELAEYRREKLLIHQKSQKLERMRSRKRSLEARKKEKACFGTKKLYDARLHPGESGFESRAHWLREFRKRRDNRAFFLGAASEEAGNQRAQLAYDPARRAFDLYLRREYCLGGEGKADPRRKDRRHWARIGGLRFPHGREDLARALGGGDRQPLTVTVSRRRGKWLVSVSLRREVRAPGEWNSDSFNGCFGIDFNEGFIEAAETDGSGNMVGAFPHAFSHQGRDDGRALDEMRRFAKRMALLAKSRHKDIWIEDLDFTKKKAKTAKAVSRAGKRYNRMMHALSYRRFRECLADACMKERVYLGTVNPANTTKIGEAKFSGRMKVTAHRAAAFVIARRGMGIWDKMPRRKKRKGSSKGAAAAAKKAA